MALPTLERLSDEMTRYNDGDEQALVRSIEVVCPEDRFSQRSKLVEAPTKLFCQKRGIQFHPMPPRNERSALLERWSALQERVHGNFDIGIVISFGYFLPKYIINAFPCGAINVHPSLLPKYRGAAPIDHALLNNDSETGVSIIEVDPKRFDAGAVLMQRRYSIDDSPDVTVRSMISKLSVEGAGMVMDTLRHLDEFRANATDQDDNGEHENVKAPKLAFSFGEIDWMAATPANVFGMYRALNSRSGIYTHLSDGRRLHLGKARLSRHVKEVAERNFCSDNSCAPGTAIYDRKSKLVWVRCGLEDDHMEQWIAFGELRPEGRRAVSALDFANGFRFLKGGGLLLGRRRE
eukprot:g954.t1